MDLGKRSQLESRELPNRPGRMVERMLVCKCGYDVCRKGTTGAELVLGSRTSRSSGSGSLYVTVMEVRKSNVLCGRRASTL